MAGSEQDAHGDRQRVAVITGGSQGIGAGLVAGYRRRGWAVVASARTMKAAADPGIVTVEGDITDPGTAQRIVDAALGSFGRIDTRSDDGVLRLQAIHRLHGRRLRPGHRVNLAGFFWLTQLVIAEMLRHRHGHVVNISAAIAERADSGTPAVLTALTKGGLAAATRSLAVEYASRGIRVNAVAPGIIQTPAHPAESYAALGDQLPPLGRVGQVSDVVDGICLESAPYVTGEILHVDGGQAAGH